MYQLAQPHFAHLLTNFSYPTPFQCIKRLVVLTTEWLPWLQTVATANLATFTTRVACSQNLKAMVVHTNAISHPRNWARH